jgi:enoyl-CoA hydratase
MTEPEILIETTGALGRIRLNRPRAINSLTLAMVKSIDAALARFESDPEIGAVLVTGEGERGLCAGGDIRALYDHGRDGSGFGEAFFRAEYRMNARIAEYRKPYIAIMDGITMGGGVGIAAHGTVRIVTERTRMAMPETGIGFFPDVGGTWLLGHGPGEVGTFIGLTGDSFGGADAIYAGFADCLVQSAALPALLTALTTLASSSSVDDVFAKLAPFTQAATAPLAAQRAEIDAAFAHDSVEAIVAALRACESPFASKTLAVLAQKSPTSMKVTLRLLRLARTDQRLQQSLEREFIAVHQVLASDEFYEGVRAAVVDKDRNPKWRPATLAEVTPAALAAYFAATPEPLF